MDIARSYVDLSFVLADAGRDTRVFAVWTDFVALLGNINGIAPHKSHTVVLQLLWDMYIKNDMRKHSYALGGPGRFYMPQFMPWVFEAGALPGTEHRESRLVAYRLMCDIMLARCGGQPRMEHQATFFALVMRALRQTEDDELAFVVLRHCRDLFARGLSGAMLLIPDIVAAVRGRLGHGFFRPSARLFSDAADYNPSSSLPRVEAVTLVSSMVCLTRVYFDCDMPSIDDINALLPERGLALDYTTPAAALAADPPRIISSAAARSRSAMGSGGGGSGNGGGGGGLSGGSGSASGLGLGAPGMGATSGGIVSPMPMLQVPGTIVVPPARSENVSPAPSSISRSQSLAQLQLLAQAQSQRLLLSPLSQILPPLSLYYDEIILALRVLLMDESDTATRVLALHGLSVFVVTQLTTNITTINTRQVAQVCVCVCIVRC